MRPIPLTAQEGVGLDLQIITGPQLFAIVTVIGLIAAAAVFLDARRRDVRNPGIWGLAVGFLFLLYAIPGIGALVLYLVVRRAPSDRRA